MTLAIGIDLGTTNSAIAYIDQHGKPVVIPNSEGYTITPSVICFKDGGVLIGEDAKELQALGAYSVAAFFKRQIGDEQFVFYANEIDHTATDLSAILLKKLKRDAEAHLGQIINDAVITVPAYFRDLERKATIEAGKAAGINVLQVINEPTAAAVAYGLKNKQANKTVLVYDLGGGTFDVTLLDYTKDTIHVKSSDGDHQLGGKDWDERIVEYLASQFQDEYGIDPLEDAESLADLLVQAEDAKKRLSTMQKTNISINHEGERGRYVLDRNTFENITSDLMARTISLTKIVLEDMNMLPSDIDGVLLVGGSTRMPMVHQFTENFFGEIPMAGVNVDEAIALGAALVADERLNAYKPIPVFGLTGRVKTIDVTNHSLGMIATNADNSAYINTKILLKNVDIPCTESRPYQFATRNRGDNSLEVFITQGESESPADVSYLNLHTVHDIPHYQGELAVVDIYYHYDESGTVKVEAKDKKSGEKLQVSEEKLPNDIPVRFMEPPVIEEIVEHVTAYIALDMSGSMSGRPLEDAIKAAYGFVENTDITHCSIGIITFADRVSIDLQATQDVKRISRVLNKLTIGSLGCCNEADPFDEINKLLSKEDGRKFAIVLTDGVWSHQNHAVLKAKKCHSNEIDVIAIGFGGADENFLKKIASSDESSFLTSQEGLVETFSNIAQVITETGGGSSVPSSGNKLKRGFGLFSR